MTDSSIQRPDVRLAAHAEGFALGVCDEVIVSVWRRPITEALLQSVADVSAELQQAYPQGLGALTILGKGVMMSVTTAVRKGARELIEKSRAHIRCRALIIEGEGFYASTIRSLLIGIGYIHQRQAELLPTIEDAGRHLGRGLGHSENWQYDLVDVTHSFIAKTTSEPTRR